MILTFFLVAIQEYGCNIFMQGWFPLVYLLESHVLRSRYRKYY